MKESEQRRLICNLLRQRPLALSHISEVFDMEDKDMLPFLKGMEEDLLIERMPKTKPELWRVCLPEVKPPSVVPLKQPTPAQQKAHKEWVEGIAKAKTNWKKRYGL